MAGQSGSDDVYVENATSVGDFQIILARQSSEIAVLKDEAEKAGTSAEAQLAQLRVEIRMLGLQQQQAPPAAKKDERIELVDVKTMSAAIFNGFKTEVFKLWTKKVRSYANGKFDGYRSALEAVEKLDKDTIVDGSIKASWNWASAEAADSKFYDMLDLITAGEAQGIVESVPGQGFEAWRLLNVRYNSVGEMYTFDKMTNIMHQSHARRFPRCPPASRSSKRI